MTTDIKIDFCLDVSKENEVFHFDKDRLPPKYIIAGISWVKDYESRTKTRSDILRHIVSLLNDKFSNINIWYFTGHSLWQCDSRILRYYGLWGGLKAQGVMIDQFSELHEKLIECDGKLKFFGAAKIADQSIESVAEAIAQKSCSYVVVLPQNTDIKETLRKGWHSDYSFDKQLIEYVIKNNGLLFKAVGEFDDLETGFVGLASPDLITKLVCNQELR